MTAVALRCSAHLRRTGLWLGVLLVLVLGIPFHIEPLQFPWQVLTDHLPLRLVAIPSIGLVMTVLGLFSAPLLLTRTLAALVAGAAVLVLFGTAGGSLVGMPGWLPLSLLATTLVLLGTAGTTASVAPWSSMPRAIVAGAIVAGLSLYFIPGIAGTDILAVASVRALTHASGKALVVPAATLVPLALCLLSVPTLLPPRLGSRRVLARSVGALATAFPSLLAGGLLLVMGASSMGLAAIVGIILLAAFAWLSSGMGVLLFGLFGGDEPPSDQGTEDPLDSGFADQYFQDRTSQMDAWKPEEDQDDGESTRMISSPQELLRQSARHARPTVEPEPEPRPAPRPRRDARPDPQEVRTVVKPSARRPAPRVEPPPPEEPGDSDKTVVLDRPFGKNRK